MKRKYLGGTIPTLVFLLAASVPAWAKNSHYLTIDRHAVLNSTSLTAGAYRIQWEAHSSGLTVTFSKEGKVVATTEGKLVDRGVKYGRDVVVYDTRPDGSVTISEIRLGGMSQAIVFGEAAP